MKEDDLPRILDAAAEPDPGRILDALIQTSGAERGYLVMRDGIPVTRDMSGDEVKVSRTLLARAVAEGRPLVASDAEVASVDSLRGQKVRSVCVFPLHASGCAVYLDRSSGAFAAVEGLARYAAALDKALMEHSWPGNVHELVHTLGRAAVLSETGVLEAPRFVFPKTDPKAEGVVSIDDHVRAMLKKWGDQLGISRKTLWEKKKKWGL